MSNTLYSKAKESLLTAQINWLTDTFKSVLVKSSYSPDFNNHRYLSDVDGIIPGNQHIKTLTNKTVTNGAADADNLVFNYVASGYNIKYVLVYKDTGVSTTSPLILLIDSGAGLPLISTGADIYITWDNGTNKIFSL